MRVLIVLAALCVLLVAATTSDAPEAVRNAHYPGRSADIFLTTQSDNDLIHQNSAFVLITPGDLPVMLTPGADPWVQDVDVADLVAHSVGTSAINMDAKRDVAVGTVFDKARANVLFALDGVGADVLEEYPGLRVLSRGRKMEMRQTAWAQDTVSQLTTLMTGVEPHQHGVVGATWVTSSGRTAHAYRGSDALPRVSSLPDRLSTSSLGKALVLGTCANAQLAAALSTHPALYTDHPFWNDFSYAWSEEEAAYTSLYPYAIHEPAFAVSRLDVITFKRKPELPGIKFDYNKRQVVVSVAKAGVQAVFDMGEAADFALWAEIQFMLSTLDALSPTGSFAKYARDDAPDFLAFGFSALRTLSGSRSMEKFRTALYVVDALMTHALDRLASVYGDRLVAQALFLDPTPAPVVSDADAAAVERVVGEYASAIRLPGVWVDTDVTVNAVDYAALCTSLQAAVSPGTSVHCMDDASAALAPLGHEWSYFVTDVGNSSNTTHHHEITWEDVHTFQVSLWITVFLVVAILMGSLAVFFVDIPTDSLLIRQTPNLWHNPNQHQQRDLW